MECRSQGRGRIASRADEHIKLSALLHTIKNMKTIEIFFNRIYFGIYYPWYILNHIVYGDSFDKIAIKVREKLNIRTEEMDVKSSKIFSKKSSDFISMQIANLVVGITMYLPATILLNEIIHPLSVNLISFVSLWGGLFILYLYLTYILYSKNDKKIKYLAEFLKEPSWKKCIWSIISPVIIIVVWWTTIIAYNIMTKTI